MPYEYTCPQCGRKYIAEWSGRVYCSRACAHAALRTRIERRCEHCGKTFQIAPCVVAKGSGRYCSKPCADAGKSVGDLRAYLLKHREIDPETGCWNWTGYVLSTGYGQVRGAGKKYSVHRLSAHFYLGLDLDSPLIVCHHCDNRRCFNPDHLFFGTRADNYHDAYAKGRATIGQKVWTVKLNEAQVREIRALAAAGHKQAELAKRFGVHYSTVSAIVRRATWRHVA